MQLRDRMAHRGPDGAGLWDGGHALLAHRRLAVIDLSDAAAQPFGDGQSRLGYNGELYNDAEIRDSLAAFGVHFRTRADTETVYKAIEAWRVSALARFRGMFALAYLGRDRLLLARDPMGIKPLYWRREVRGGRAEILFSSEVTPLAQLGDRAPKPDPITLSSYLTTIRTTLGQRTLYKDVFTLKPGEWIEWDLSREDLPHCRGDIPLPPVCPEDVGSAVRESVRLHLRADVPACSLLSGGLDSSIITSIAAEHGPIRTYCSGDVSDESGDFSHARMAAEHLETIHAEAPITASLFRLRWPELIRRTGLPLSTPNEVAINEVARALRRDGNIVALSGEGADELFGGYDHSLRETLRFLRGQWSTTEPIQPHNSRDGGIFRLHEAAWVPLSAKNAILNPDLLREVEFDGPLIDEYRTEFARCGGDADLNSHLRFFRRINLAGLLLRLDSATMLEGVEGRTPFADAVIASFAENLPAAEKFDESASPPGKRCLRDAFALLPRDVLLRPKASFPLPFERWSAGVAGVLRNSPLARACFTTAAIETVAAQPTRLWRLAWPMINVALWGGTLDIKPTNRACISERAALIVT